MHLGLCHGGTVSIVINFMLFMLVFSVHELGHAFAMRKHGLEIEEITLFGFGPKLLSFKLRRWFGNTPVYVRLIPLLAYVRLTDQAAEKEAQLSYRAKAEVYGAGVHANLVYGLTLGTVSITVKYATEPKDWVFGGCLLLGTLMFARLRSWVCAYVFPFLLPALVLSLFVPLFGPTDPHAGVQGPFAVLSNSAHGIKTANPLVFMAEMADLSLGLGLINLLPFHPFDGGKLLEALLKNWLPTPWHARLGTIITYSLAAAGIVIVLAILSTDILNWLWP